MLCGRDNLDLGLAPHEGYSTGCGPAAPRRRAARSVLGSHGLPAGEVADARIAHLARAHGLVEGGHRLVDRDGLLEAVDLPQVEVVGAEIGQRLVELAQQRAQGPSVTTLPSRRTTPALPASTISSRTPCLSNSAPMTRSHAPSP